LPFFLFLENKSILHQFRRRFFDIFDLREDEIFNFD
jgi:hypothetical protein